MSDHLQRALSEEVDDGDDFPIESDPIRTQLYRNDVLDCFDNINANKTDIKNDNNNNNDNTGIPRIASISSIKSTTPPFYAHTAGSSNVNSNSDDVKNDKNVGIGVFSTAPTSPERKSADIDNNNYDNNGIDFLRIWIQREKQERDTPEVRKVCRQLKKACMMREKWVCKDKLNQYPHSLIKDEDVCLNINIVKNALPKKSNHTFTMKHGVFRVYKLHKKRKKKLKTNKKHKQNDIDPDITVPPISMKSRKSVNDDNNDNVTDGDDDSECDYQQKIEYEYIADDKPLYNVHSFGEFMKDLYFIMELATNGPARTFCYQRLQTLQAKFKLHILLNETNETAEVRRVPHRDFYNVRKVDNHVHHSACMTQKHLLRFIKSRIKHCGDEIVYSLKNREYTLKELFTELNLGSYDLSIDTLSMHGHRDTFHRFDRFNNKYNPIGQSSLRQVFLKVDNYHKGKFLADITKEVMDDLIDSKYQYSEYRLSIYGKKITEWDILASWICDNNLHSTNVRWMIQIPRLYAIYKASGLIQSFGQMLDNIFKPLFEVSINPSSHPKLHLFLTLVVGFDTVDDESIREHSRYEKYPEPEQWTNKTNPPYIVWSYYIYANLFILNQLREARGFNLFSYRPHAGEAGDPDHCASSFLLAQSINHGLTLKKVPVLQYLYYLKQIGLSMSPLSNNLLFLEYDRNPFNIFFQRGLNVTLSTDDPLMIHYTKDPLIEEYAIAGQVYKLSAIDMCEIARNSVIQSGFPKSYIKHWLGADFRRRGPDGNNIKQSNVPNIRLLFRDELLAEEENWILGLPPPIFPTISLLRPNLKSSLKPKHINLKHSKKLSLYKSPSKNRNRNKNKNKHLRNHMNYLIAHRTTIPFNFNADTTPQPQPQPPPSPSVASNNSRQNIDRLDPLGYFSKPITINRYQIDKSNSYLDQSIPSIQDYNIKYKKNDKQNQNQNQNKNDDNKWFNKLSNVATKQFVMIAIGLVVGYIIANVNQRKKDNDKKTND